MTDSFAHFPSLWGSLIQSFCSSVLTIILAAIICSVILKLPERARRGVELFSIFVGTVPSFLWAVAWMGYFPGIRGIGPVILIHAFQQMYLFAVILAVHFNEIAPDLKRAVLLGCGRWKLWWSVLIPPLRGQILVLFLSLNWIFLSSFSLPLVLQDRTALSLETLLYYRFREQGTLNATDLSIWLAVFLFFLGAFAWIDAALGVDLSIKSFSSRKQDQWLSDKLYPASLRKLAWGIATVPSIWAVGICLIEIPEGLRQLALLNLQSTVWFKITLLGVALAIVGAVITCLGLTSFLLFAVFSKNQRRSNIWPGFSLIILAFGFGMLLREMSEQLQPFIVGLVALILWGAALWRWVWVITLNKVRASVYAALLLGSSRRQIVRNVIWTHFRGPATWTFGIVSLWLLGDFAIVRLVAPSYQTLTTVSQDLTHTYRSEAATVLTLVSLCLGLLIFFGAQLTYQRAKVRDEN